LDDSFSSFPGNIGSKKSEGNNLLLIFCIKKLIYKYYYIKVIIYFFGFGESYDNLLILGLKPINKGFN